VISAGSDLIVVEADRGTRELRSRVLTLTIPISALPADEEAAAAWAWANV